MAEVLSGSRPDNVLYVKATPQGGWMEELIKTEVFSTCPKRKGKKPTNELTAPVYPNYLITAAAAEEIRNHLISMPNRPIMGFRA